MQNRILVLEISFRLHPALPNRRVVPPRRLWWCLIDIFIPKRLSLRQRLRPNRMIYLRLRRVRHRRQYTRLCWFERFRFFRRRHEILHLPRIRIARCWYLRLHRLIRILRRISRDSRHLLHSVRRWLLRETGGAVGRSGLY